MGVAGGGAKHGGVEHVEAGEVCCLRGRGGEEGEEEGVGLREEGERRMCRCR